MKKFNLKNILGCTKPEKNNSQDIEINFIYTIWLSKYVN